MVADTQQSSAHAAHFNSAVYRTVQRIKDLQGLAVRDGGTGRSWYLPGRTYLTVIGRRDVLASINLNYPVAVPECAPRRCAGFVA